MFNWKDDKSRLTSVVALSYNSGNGLKVNDVASNVGQGWSLLAGGVIARMQVGEPDDQPAFNGNGREDDITKYPAGYMYAKTPAYKGVSAALTKYPIYGAMNQQYAQHNETAEDKQLDYFSFQFNGKSGLFVLDTKNGDVGYSLGDSKMKISFQRDASMITNTNQGIRTTITSFTIQDVDGIIYKFKTHGLTKVMHAGFIDIDMTEEQHQPNFEHKGIYPQTTFDNGETINPFVINSWYLSEIIDPLIQPQRKIVLSYNQNVINSPAGFDVSDNRSIDKSYILISHKNSNAVTQDISSITYPDGHEVHINYGDARVDLKGEYTIASVDVSYQGRYLSRYQLNTSYFILNRYGTPVTDYQKSVARLCLKSVKKFGIDLKEDSPPYIFDYYLGSDSPDDFVPPPFFYAKDIFGFYNGDKSIDYNGNTLPLRNTSVNQLNFDQLRGLCFLTKFNDNGYPNTPVPLYVAPKSGYAKNGLLRQIVFPGGGTLSYEYSQNKGSLSNVVYASGSSSFVGGVSVAATKTTDGGYSNGCDNPVVTNYKYVLADGISSSIWGLETPVNTLVSNSHYAREYKDYRWPPFLFGECYWHFQYPGILSQQQAISLSNFQKVMDALGPTLNVINALSSINDVAQIVTAATGGTAAPVMAIIDVIVNLVSVGLTCIGGDQAKDFNTTVYYNTDLNSSSPLPTQYKRVEIIEGTGTIGKTVQEFTSSDDYAVWVPANANVDHASKQRFAPWAYGLPKTTAMYNAAGNLIKQTTNIYDFAKTKNILSGCISNTSAAAVNSTGLKNNLSTNATISTDPCVSNPSGINSNLISCKATVNNIYSQRSTVWSDPNEYTWPSAQYLTTSNSDITVDFYGMYSGRVELLSTSEKIFNTADASKFVESVTSYSYNTLNNYDVNQIITQQSNGDINYKTIKYNSDYTVGVLSVMTQNNILSQPVETSLSVRKGSVSGNLQYLSEEVTEFTQLANGDIKPLRTLEQRFSQPASSMNTYQGPGNASNPPYKQTQSFTYDVAGNMVGLKDEGAHTVSNIYGYNDKYVIASVINTDVLVDFPSYTSFESSSFGGWTINGPASVVNTSAVTGEKSFQLSTLGQGIRPSPNSLSANLNIAKSYLLSFWSTSALTVSGSATLLKSTPVINGFTYYEYKIPAGTSTINISGDAFVDELRIYPENARMRSVSYDPLIGKTSECDENNRITYYEYDNLGRLRFIKDENKSILKMYEYNNVSAAKQNGCPGTYSNHLITEYFKKSNCSSGYAGLDVSFTIPAGKYTSSISQYDADLQAELDLNTNGQQNADNYNGSCARIFYSAAKSGNAYTQTCEIGYKGGLVTYTIPAGKYTSLNNQKDADDKAQVELNANLQAYANSPAHAICVVDPDPVWVADDNSQTKCGTGAQAGHRLYLATNINPNNSATTGWMDRGPDASCPIIIYPNDAMDPVFTKNNCPVGGTGIQVTFHVAASTFTSTESIADANVKAQNYINTNGQNYANTNGECIFRNAAITGSFTKNNCTGGVNPTGTSVPFTFAAGLVTSNVDQATADRNAYQLFLSQGQAYANANGSCINHYPNEALSKTYTASCSSGGTPTSKTFSIAAGVFESTESQKAANDLAVANLDISGNAYLQKEAYCTYYNDAMSPVFTKSCPVGGTGSQVTFYVAGGTFTSRISTADANVKAQNYINANGQNYANTNGECIFRNAAISGAFAKNDCTGGVNPTGTSVPFTFAAGLVTSNVDQATADRNAYQLFLSQGQANANTYGSCINHYPNEALSKTYTASCSSGGTPTSKTFSIAAGVFESTESQKAANDLAIANLDISGNAYLQNEAYCTYYNDAMSPVFTKSCPVGGMGSQVTFYVAAGTFTSRLSTADANVSAQNYINANGQNYADANGECIFRNAAISGAFAKNDCSGVNATGTSIPFTFAAGLVTSNVDQATADRNAYQLFLSQGQANANIYGGCIDHYYNETQTKTFTKNCPDGVGSSRTFTVPAGTYESTVSVEDANQMARDNNDLGGSIYLQSSDATCTYYNDAKSKVFQKSCPSGQTGSSYTYTVPAGKFSSSSSKADANILAQNDIDANGQAAADNDPNGSCAVTGIYAKMEIDPIITYADGTTYAEIYIRFFSDAAGTVPVNANGIKVNYSYSSDCHGGYSDSGSVFPVANYVRIRHNVIIAEGDCCGGICFVNYVLEVGSGYTVIF